MIGDPSSALEIVKRKSLFDLKSILVAVWVVSSGFFESKTMVTPIQNLHALALTG